MNKNDIRYQKTEENLRSAMLKLLESRQLDRIAITAICEEAGCSRNAFYQHYETKYDLYDTILKTLIEDIQKNCEPLVCTLDEMNEEVIRRYTHNILASIQTHRREIISLYRSDPSFFEVLRGSIYEAMIRTDMVFSGRGEISSEVVLLTGYATGGITGFIHHWLLEADVPPETAKEKLDFCTRDLYAYVISILKKQNTTATGGWKNAADQ